MPDPIFDDPRLAALYDVFDDDRADLDAYVAIVEEVGARRVVDLGCGTGTLAIRLAATGREVVGVDPAAASLDVARAKPGAAEVTWRRGTADAVPQRWADVVMMTANVAQVFLTDADWAGTLRRCREALAPGGGHLVFETRRPDARAWEDWAREPSSIRDVPGEGRVESRLEVVEVALPLVTFTHTYRFPDGDEVVSRSTLRFRSRAEVEADLEAAGFVVDDVRQAADRPGREFVFLARPS